jgi:hypothetical protein
MTPQGYTAHGLRKAALLEQVALLLYGFGRDGGNGLERAPECGRFSTPHDARRSWSRLSRAQHDRFTDPATGTYDGTVAIER